MGIAPNDHQVFCYLKGRKRKKVAIKSIKKLQQRNKQTQNQARKNFTKVYKDNISKNVIVQQIQLINIGLLT